MPDMQTRGSDIHVVIGQHKAYAFVFSEYALECFALACVGGGDVMGASCLTQPAHAVRKPRGAEADLRILEAFTRIAEGAQGWDGVTDPIRLLFPA